MNKEGGVLEAILKTRDGGDETSKKTLERLSDSAARKFPDRPSEDWRDVLDVRFTVEQVVEITSHDYALKLFHLTRIKPLSVKEIKVIEPEPEEGLAEYVLNRFFEVGLLEGSLDGACYSKYPENFPNFTESPLDSELEADKDARIFQLMKQKAGDRDFWKTNAYFSEDAYLTESQIKDIKSKLQDIKFYIKHAMLENNKNGIVEGLSFIRHKSYNIFLGVVAILISMVATSKSYAGNDPGILGGSEFHYLTTFPLTAEDVIAGMEWSGGRKIIIDPRLLALEGNDPGRAVNLSKFLGQINLDTTAQYRRGYSQIDFFMRQGTVPDGNDGYWGGNDGVWGGTDGACAAQIINTQGQLNQVTLPCIQKVQTTTANVCQAYGDAGYCAVSDRISSALKDFER
jgi:hypothetical protein